MGMEKRKKPSKTERRRMHAEAIADRKRRNAEIEEQQKEEKRKAQRVEDNWTKGMSPPKQNLPPGSIWLESSDVQPNPSRSERSQQRDRSP
ncbi:unnamed protein product, partial [Aphanomyces euteiches]